MPQRVVLNLNGTRFEIGKETFMKILERDHVKLPEAETNNTKSTEYFLERHAGSFAAILDYLQHGKLHLPPNACPDTFRCELQFWGVEPRVMSHCCYRKYLTFFDDENVLQQFKRANRKFEEDNARDMKSSGCRSRIWRLLDDPSSSFGAKVYLAVSTIFIVLSLFVLAASTHSMFLRDLDENEWTEILGSEKYRELGHLLPRFGHDTSEIERLFGKSSTSRGPSGYCNCKGKGDNQTSPSTTPTSLYPDLPTSSMYARYDWLKYMEYTTAIYFTLELFIRVCFAPSTRRFFSTFLNVMDAVALLAMYSTILVLFFIPSEKYKASISDWVDCLQIVRVFRVFRIVKDVIGFRVLLYSVRSSFKEILLLILYLSIGTVLFASVLYFMERDNMGSIPDAAWWAVVTMTTVGYGDIVPISLQGKIVGCLCAISGVFLIAVTVPIFVSNFVLFYSYSKVVGEMNKANQTCGNRHSGGPEVIKMVRGGSLVKNKIGAQDVVVQDYT